MKRRSACRLTAISFLAVLSFFGHAQAETNEVRLAHTYGLVNLPTYVVAERKLIEKHAAEAGIPGLKATFNRMTSGAYTGDMLLSGNIDIGIGGFTVLMFLSDKTSGGQKIKGVIAQSDAPMVAVTIDPRIKSLKDFTDRDRIAMNAVKVTVQAITLQILASKEFGWDNKFKLDPITVSMGNPDGMASIMSGGTEVKTHITFSPFSNIELENGKGARVLFTSDDVNNTPTNGSVLFTTENWKKNNPKAYAAVVAAFTEAVEWTNGHMKEAAEIYNRAEPQKQGVDWIQSIISNPKNISFTNTPHSVKVYADFMYKTGTLKHPLSSWKDLFFENVSNMQGN